MTLHLGQLVTLPDHQVGRVDHITPTFVYVHRENDPQAIHPQVLALADAEAGADPWTGPVDRTDPWDVDYDHRLTGPNCPQHGMYRKAGCGGCWR